MPRKPTPSPRVVVFAGPNGAGKSTHADAIWAALKFETFVTRKQVFNLAVGLKDSFR